MSPLAQIGQSLSTEKLLVLEMRKGGGDQGTKKSTELFGSSISNIDKNIRMHVDREQLIQTRQWMDEESAVAAITSCLQPKASSSVSKTHRNRGPR